MFLDILLLIVVAWGFITGYRRGIIHSLFFLAGIGVGLLMAIKFSALAGTHLSEWLAVDPTYLPIISFALVFLLTLGGVILLANALEGLLKFAQLNLFNKLAGAAVWITIGVFVLSTAFWYLHQYDLLGAEQIETSQTYTYVAAVSPFVLEQIGALVPLFRDLYTELESMIQGSPAPLDIQVFPVDV